MIHTKNIASGISYLLSPNVIAFYIIILFFLYPPIGNNTNNLMNLMLSIFFLCIFPIIMIVYFNKKGKIDIWVSNQKDRTPFYIIAIIGYIIASILFYVLDNITLFVLSLAYAGVTLTVTLSNFNTKVSSHSAGVAGPLTAITYLYGFISLPVFLLLPLVFWARLKLNAHSINQLIYGTIIGISITFFVFYLLIPPTFSPLL